MALRAGIVGLPNVGKSTVFNALTAAGVAAENYPFCTVDPNSGVVPLPDPRLDAIAALVKPERVVPASVELVDIAGLVRGASRGEGLGNQFLAHIREVHAIVHVVRCFEDPNLAHVEGSVDPLRDVETVETELALADLGTLERRLERVRRAAKTGAREAREEAAFFDALLRHVSEARPARAFEVSDRLAAAYRDCHLLTAKPVLYVANVDEAGLERGNSAAEALEAHAARAEAGVVRLCAKLEAELTELPEAERRAFLAELGLEEPGLARLARAAYELLGLITFFTAEPAEARAWPVPAGTHAAQAAGEIHTDFERHFVRAEVAPFEDFVAAGGLAGARTHGRMRIEGRDYVVRDGDVIHFRAGA